MDALYPLTLLLALAVALIFMGTLAAGAIGRRIASSRDRSCGCGSSGAQSRPERLNGPKGVRPRSPAARG